MADTGSEMVLDLGETKRLLAEIDKKIDTLVWAQNISSSEALPTLTNYEGEFRQLCTLVLAYQITLKNTTKKVVKICENLADTDANI